MTLFCNYTWKIYANKMLNMGSIYTFWRWVNNEQKEAKQRYIKMFYNLMYKNLVSQHILLLDAYTEQSLSCNKNDCHFWCVNVTGEDNTCSKSWTSITTTSSVQEAKCQKTRHKVCRTINKDTEMLNFVMNGKLRAQPIRKACNLLHEAFTARKLVRKCQCC